MTEIRFPGFPRDERDRLRVGRSAVAYRVGSPPALDQPPAPMFVVFDGTPTGFIYWSGAVRTVPGSSPPRVVGGSGWWGQPMERVSIDDALRCYLRLGADVPVNLERNYQVVAYANGRRAR